MRKYVFGDELGLSLILVGVGENERMSESAKLGRIRDVTGLDSGVEVHISYSCRKDDIPVCFVTVDHGKDSGRIEGVFLDPEKVRGLREMLGNYLDSVGEPREEQGDE